MTEIVPTNQTIQLSAYRPHPRNYNRHPAGQVERIAHSLSTFGQVRSIVVWGGYILAGHGVAEAAQALGWDSLRADVLPDEYPEHLALAYVAADNELSRLSDPDRAQLASILDEAKQTDDALLRAIGYDDAEFEQLLREVEADAGLDNAGADTEPQIDKAEELRQKWGVETGQLWQLGEHRLICGDCTDAAVVARVMAGEKADCVVTDPPYGIGWDTDYTRFTTEYGTHRVAHPPVINDDREFDPRPFLEYEKVILWGANWYCRHIPIGSWLIWDKRHPNGTAWLSDAEIAWMKGGKGVYIYAETVQGAHRKERAMHPTQKPVGLIQWCIEKVGVAKIVFEPYNGSGTTIIACENLGRRCRAVEISPGYVAVALERYHQHTGKMPELIER